MKVRIVYLASVIVFAVFNFYIGVEGFESAFVSMGAPAGAFPHPGVLAGLNFLALLPFLLISAKAERWWSGFPLLFISAVGLFWAGAGVQFGVPARAILIPLATGLAGLGLFLAHLKLKQTDER